MHFRYFEFVLALDALEVSSVFGYFSDEWALFVRAIRTSPKRVETANLDQLLAIMHLNCLVMRLLLPHRTVLYFPHHRSHYRHVFLNESETVLEGDDEMKCLLMQINPIVILETVDSMVKKDRLARKIFRNQHYRSQVIDF